ncbi:2,4-diaminopentanoate dehydrogenase [Natranaerobius thermophilus]|uniref:Dihydrodipicolinate reductase n=1 Tax=Natranaerobius thermophilus (strain ATCC BAA-1301 / DSM 18059 / JW/NM-WN-LF) TaxID=457570 RepID=B2A1K9_NATTJ|nr:2,4-diaminopentanoate dehydrogenase [Natranaerobius thermophilus]ACB84749.1 dihydrodipicolinate reductase [Natranaerobius thermophilus JW/NM-WN-LF]
MENIRVLVRGLGNMGSGMAKMVIDKEGLDLVGGVAGRPNKVGKDVGEVVGREAIGVNVNNDLVAEIKDKKPDVVLQANTSFTKDAFPEIKEILEQGVNVISIAEEMAYPSVQEKELAQQMDEIAKKNGVSVLGTGVNPGFVLDTLIIALSGGAISVDSIKASRVNDLSPFGATVMKTQGVGTTVEEFNKGVEEGTIVGHVGFPESIYMIADALGITLDKIEETREPIVSETYRETEHVKVEPGMVAGCRHVGKGFKDGEELIVLEHPQQIHPDKEGVDTGDYIYIKGNPEINMSINPEVPGGVGTIATAVNMIPLLVDAPAGLTSMKDLPVPRAIVGDVKKIMGRR